jgi:valyl-tRNA synthetase
LRRRARQRRGDETVIHTDVFSIPAHFDSKAAEEKWDRLWAEWGVYRFDEASRRETFVIDTPPPTVSGSLHVGHVFSYTQTDVAARFHRMRGRNVFYPMGWDDNGLPTERRVQNYYHVRCVPGVAPRKDASRPAMAGDEQRKHPPRSISRDDFICLCLELTHEDEKAFKALWQRLALSVDWSLEYSTIDERSRRIAQWSFLDLYQKGQVYSLEAPTMWDVDFGTAVAQAEVEDRLTRGAYHHLRFGVLGMDLALDIATTRPELLPACVGVAAHPDDERYRALFGKRAVSPLFRVPIPIFPTELADPAKGTGILMVCTFGDATDVHWWREQKLALRQIIGRDGRLLPIRFGDEGWESLDPEAADRFYSALSGKSVREARKTIVEMLRDAAGSASHDHRPPLASDPEPIEHAVKFFEKGDHPLEFVTTRQWFVRVLEHKSELIALGDTIQWHPEFMRARYRNWTENLQLDWCISRQRFFGVPFPVWYPADAEGRADYSRPILATADSLPADPTTSAPPGYREEQRDALGGFRAENDVFDTWFTSSLTPQIASGWFLDKERHARLFPMDLRPQSHEIIRTWAFYTIVKAFLHEKTLPWRNVGISGWVLDPDRKKMSKSRGNVVTPLHLLDQYGADAVRYWSASAKLGVDTAYDEKVFKIGRRLITKIFNASKYVLSQTGSDGAVTRPLDLGFLERLRETVARATAELEAYDHAAALDLTEHFFWNGFTDAFLEMVKARARSETDPEGRASAVAALRLGLKTLLRLLAPFLPYITEEAWSWYFASQESRSIHESPWPSDADFEGMPASRDCGAAFDAAMAFLESVHRAKTAAGASVGRHLDLLCCSAHPRTAKQLRRVEEDLRSAARASLLEIEDRADNAERHIEVTKIELAPQPKRDS